jgi:hypothetical protein
MNQRVLRALSVIRNLAHDPKTGPQAVKNTFDACKKWMTTEEFQALQKAHGGLP